mmetsp:Transcript_42367/g.75917  ORF Transcript_42367/g.75917 Transcript_42367/m.75917 type:complete len:103 (-) Transcript_42367:1396-1704(-)
MSGPSLYSGNMPSPEHTCMLANRHLCEETCSFLWIAPFLHLLALTSPLLCSVSISLFACLSIACYHHFLLKPHEPFLTSSLYQPFIILPVTSPTFFTAAPIL